MKSESAELVSGLIRQYRRLRLLYLGYLAAAVLALVFFFVDKRVTLALVAASLVYHLVVVRRAGKAYQRAFVHACGQCTLARRLQDARHTEAPTLEEGELRRARLVAANDAKGSVLVREGGSGTYHGRRVRLGDAGFTHSFSMEGKTHHEFVVGTWVTVELGKDTGLDWRLIHERVMMKPSRDAMLRRESGLRRVVGFGPDWMEDGTWFALRPEGKPGAVLHPVGAEAHHPPQPALPAQHGVPGRLHHHPLVDEPPVQPGVLPQLHRHPGAHHELVVGFPLHGEGMGKPGVTQAHTAAVVGTGAALPHQDGALGVVGGDQAGAAQLPLLQGGRFGVAGVLKAPGQGTLAAGVDKGPLVGLPRPPYHHQVVDQAGRHQRQGNALVHKEEDQRQDGRRQITQVEQAQAAVLADEAAYQLRRF